MEQLTIDPRPVAEEMRTQLERAGHKGWRLRVHVKLRDGRVESHQVHSAPCEVGQVLDDVAELYCWV